ncbi:MAG: phospholipase D-like domain-containing protein [Candidatus Helarchaeota archaeon]
MITRSPDSEKEGFGRDSKKAYHQVLDECGVKVYYNDYIHAKLLMVDDLLSVVSSMNFHSGSSGGRSWEAGLITWEEGVINSIVKSIQRIQYSPETNLYN